MSQEYQSLYDKIVILEDKYASLRHDVKNLEESNIETDNVLYELSNSIEAVDTRIDILTGEQWIKNNES